MKKYIFSLLFIAYCMGCTKTTVEKVPINGEGIDMASIVRVSSNFSLFAYALKRTGMDTVLASLAPHTLLLPDNPAFATVGILNNGDIDRMALDSLKRWVGMHILPLAIPSTDIPRTINRIYLSVNGDSLHVTHNSSSIRFNGVLLTTLDQLASNGVIHILQRPLRIPSPSVKYFLTHDSSYSIIAAALQRFGLLDQLGSGGPYTLLAPYNNAMIGEGITLDSVNRMDPGQFRPFVFSTGTIPGFRIYYQDIQDNDFAPPGYMAVIQPDYVLYKWDSGPAISGPGSFAVYDPKRSFLNPDWVDPTGNGSVYLGPNPFNWWIPGSGGNTGAGPQMDPSTSDFDCDNGVVHGLNDILVWPDSARIH